ncbi:hypothetical protein NQ314_001662 [Rhamnusium bicolor]|uniref:PiggyBac transposable element-derived protein domain-containing protein n=1 Tax=Rhamnusium bicolor TaxID=1586634 RepID=A0AAV8ZT81_9CUCU|nr:hypothetical protein NQ314_001662 [Rhamnusium bicolor]
MKGGRVETDLTRDLVGNHHEIYMDNYFSSVGLYKKLQDEGIYTCGTVRMMRKHIPKYYCPDKNMKRRF